MVMTVLEARVESEDWDTLKTSFNTAITALDTGIIETFLVQTLNDANTWRIITVWESDEALDLMRASGETPRGVLIFQEANARPTLSIYAVASHAHANTAPGGTV